MGRKKIAIEFVKKKEARMVTFSKRKSGLFKKAAELSILCGIQIAIILFSPAGKLFTFGYPSVEVVLDRFLYQRDEKEYTGEPSQNDRIQQLNQQLEDLKNQIHEIKEKGKALQNVQNALVNLDPLKMKASPQKFGDYVEMAVNDFDQNAVETLLELANQNM